MRGTLSLLLLALAGCAAPAAAPGPVPPTAAGHLFIVGGGSQPDALVERFVTLAGGPGRARIAVLPMASGAPDESGRSKAEQLRRFGADAFVLNLDRSGASSDSVARIVEGATGVWFNGGDQGRLARVLAGTPVLEAIGRAYRAGAVVGGTSAGAAVLSDSMITGSQFRDGADTVGYFGDEFPSVARRVIEVRPGFGLLPGAIVDQHFLRRERQNRLLAAILERPALVGLGIDESTAVLVRPDGLWEVIGRSAALVYDARAARVTPPGEPVLGAADVRVHVLSPGSVFDPRRGRVVELGDPAG